VAASQAPLATIQIPYLTRKIPPRSRVALTGSQFASSILGLHAQEREQAILRQILSGNVPSFLRKLVPVKLKSEAPDGKTLIATIFVMPDYLAIGSDRDFLRIPMDLETAAAIAARFGFVLPTRKEVDAIYAESPFHFVPQPLPAGPQMTSTKYYQIHNELIDEQAHNRGIPLGALVAGDKKDLVVTNRLARRPGRIAIYGWHLHAGAPIQPLSTVHGACYADYSHGIRLVSQIAMLNGKPRRVDDILQDPSLAKVLSDEGAIRGLRNLAALTPGECKRDTAPSAALPSD
jgi:hypothetical protein